MHIHNAHILRPVDQKPAAWTKSHIQLFEVGKWPKRVTVVDVSDNDGDVRGMQIFFETSYAQFEILQSNFVNDYKLSKDMIRNLSKQNHQNITDCLKFHSRWFSLLSCV